MALPIDIVVVGTALNDRGFISSGDIDGLGLNTFGFIWPCSGIWGPTDAIVSNVWTANDAGVTTGWTFYIPPNATIENCTD